MNDLDLMERFRANAAPADPETLAQARASMFRADTGAARRPRSTMFRAGPASARRPRVGIFRVAPGRPPARRMWQLVPTAGVAVAAIVAAVAISASAPPPAATSASAPTPPAATSPDAGQVLRLAAVETRQDSAVPARPGQFVFQETKYSHFGVQAWLSVDGSRPGVVRPLPGVKIFLTQPNNEVVPSVAAYRRDLPTDPAAMRRYLYAGHPGDDSKAWGTVTLLLWHTYLPPASEAALFEAASAIPGTTVQPGQIDPVGRPAIAVSRSGKGTRFELLFDPATYRYLGFRTVGTDGTTLTYSALLRTAIVDKVGQLP